MQSQNQSLAFMHGKPSASGKIKVLPEDFIVSESLSFTPSGKGEHLMIRIKKVSENTSFVANELAKACGVKSFQISWAGLKDRHAITDQWFSVHLPKAGLPDLSDFFAKYPQLTLLEMTRHDRKLRHEDIKENHFSLRFREVSDIDEVLTRLELISKTGVPNYFGRQRFGHGNNNVLEARRFGREGKRIKSQHLKGLYLSAARSWIFNQIVSARLEQGCFDRAFIGDMVVMDDTFEWVNETSLNQVNRLITEGRAWLTAPLAGDNALTSKDEAQSFEQGFLDAEADLMKLIRDNRMRHDRRALRFIPRQLSWQVEGDRLVCHFTLSSGCYATSVVRELIDESATEVLSPESERQA